MPKELRDEAKASANCSVSSESGQGNCRGRTVATDGPNDGGRKKGRDDTSKEATVLEPTADAGGRSSSRSNPIASSAVLPHQGGKHGCFETKLRHSCIPRRYRNVPRLLRRCLPWSKRTCCFFSLIPSCSQLGRYDEVFPSLREHVGRAYEVVGIGEEKDSTGKRTRHRWAVLQDPTFICGVM